MIQSATDRWRDLEAWKKFLDTEFWTNWCTFSMHWSSCEYENWMWIVGSWRWSGRYLDRNADYESPLVTWSTVEYCLTVVCRGPKYVRTGCVVCYDQETLLCAVSQLLFIYFALWCLPILLCHVIILFYIFDSWRWMNNESEDWSPSDIHYTFLSLWNNTCDYFSDDVHL